MTLYFSKVYGVKGASEHWWNLGPLCLLGGIVGARVWQVFFFDWSFYSQHPGQILLIWHGGLSIQGGIVGGILVGVWYLWRHKQNILHFADLAAPGILIGQSIGRDADFMNGSAYGSPTHQNFGVLFPVGTLAHDQYGNQPLWPSVIWEGQADIILFALLLILYQRKRGWPQGFAFSYYLIAYNIVRFFLEMLRGDSPRFALGWDAAQYTAVVNLVIGVALLIWIFVSKHRKTLVYTTPPTE